MINNLTPNPHETEDNKRLMLAIAISLAILLGFSLFFKNEEQIIAPATIATEKGAVVNKGAANEAVTSVRNTDAEKIVPRADALKTSSRIAIKGDKISGSIALKGARFDDVALNDYYTTVENKENVKLLNPYGSSNSYYIESGWISASGAASVPTSETQWQIAPGSADVLKSGGEVTLQWNNGKGLLFTRNIKLDKNYLFTVTQSITNNSGAEQDFNAWHLISRRELPPEYKGMFILHEGPLAYLNNKLQEVNYKKLDKGEEFNQQGVRGWLGFTDAYWFAGILPEAKESFDSRIIATHSKSNKIIYQADIVSDTYKVLPGKSIEDKKYFYIGAKSLPLIKQYQTEHEIKKLELVYDFGMYYFITKPFYLLLHFLMSFSGNVGLAIILMTFIVRSAVFPLSNKSFRSMAKMKLIAPQLKELQDKYKDDRQKLQVEIFELYKREGANPFSGCWPMLVQIPIFFSLYKAILLSVELRHEPFWGWISDLSAPDPTSILNLFGLLPWDAPNFLQIGAWPVIFCFTMVWQKRMSPPLPDQTQEQVQAFMPYFVTLMLANFSVGLVIYWTFSNILGILQQYYIYRSMGDTAVHLVHGHSERRKKKDAKKEK